MAAKPHANSILKASQDLPLCARDPKDAAEGSRSQPQPDADGQRRMEMDSLHTHNLDGTSGPHFPTTLALVTYGILKTFLRT